VKVILKAEFSEQDETSLLIEPGSIPVSELKLMIKDRNMSKMPSIMRKAVEEAIDTYSRTNESAGNRPDFGQGKLCPHEKHFRLFGQQVYKRAGCYPHRLKKY